MALLFRNFNLRSLSSQKKFVFSILVCLGLSVGLFQFISIYVYNYEESIKSRIYYSGDSIITARKNTSFFTDDEIKELTEYAALYNASIDLTRIEVISIFTDKTFSNILLRAIDCNNTLAFSPGSHLYETGNLYLSTHGSTASSLNTGEIVRFRTSDNEIHYSNQITEVFDTGISFSIADDENELSSEILGELVYICDFEKDSIRINEIKINLQNTTSEHAYEDIKTILNSPDYYKTTNQIWNSVYSRIQSQLDILKVIVCFIFFICNLCIAYSLYQLVLLRIEEFSIIKLLTGTTNRQIRINLILEILLLSCIGTFIGLLIGGILFALSSPVNPSLITDYLKKSLQSLSINFTTIIIFSLAPIKAIEKIDARVIFRGSSLSRDSATSIKSSFILSSILFGIMICLLINTPLGFAGLFLIGILYLLLYLFHKLVFWLITLFRYRFHHYKCLVMVLLCERKKIISLNSSCMVLGFASLGIILSLSKLSNESYESANELSSYNYIITSVYEDLDIITRNLDDSYEITKAVQAEGAISTLNNIPISTLAAQKYNSPSGLKEEFQAELEHIYLELFIDAASPNLYPLKYGSFFDSNTENGIILNNYWRLNELAAIQIGDIITININHIKHDLTVIGIIDPEARWSNNCFGYISPDIITKYQDLTEAKVNCYIRSNTILSPNHYSSLSTADYLEIENVNNINNLINIYVNKQKNLFLIISFVSLIASFILTSVQQYMIMINFNKDLNMLRIIGTTRKTILKLILLEGIIAGTITSLVTFLIYCGTMNIYYELFVPNAFTLDTIISIFLVVIALISPIIIRLISSQSNINKLKWR